MQTPTNISTKEMTYSGYKVLRVQADNLDQLHYLRNLSETESDLSSKINFWSEPDRLNSSIDVMIAPDIVNEMTTKFGKQNISSKTLINDVGKILDCQKDTQNPTSLFYLAPNDTTFLRSFQSLANIYQYMDEVTRQNPILCSTEVIGKTSEGRAMKIIKIGWPGETKKEKPIVWIDAGIHAREWIAPATALIIINKLVNGESDPEISPLLDTYDFHILPSANPDGYEYSRNFDRFWRKTRSRHRASWLGLFCVGVDPNRNYEFQWKRVGSSANPCSNTYHGPHPFSEPETKAIADHVMKHRERVKLFLSLHSYSQLILTPWGYTKDPPKSYPDLMRVAQIASRAIKMRHGTEYEYGSSPSILYMSAGGSDDWAHGTAGIKYSYTFELRDKGAYGFLLPPRLIQPTGEEMTDALVAMLNEIKKELS
ncbi:hypothetical protein RDWZM_007074 [Blomia tropicalis]|uniref:Peptidase M14 domain-containing protein n=1 Tax=Blomia tropicalis TaxID=40697 RepID=A0A9Q0MB07_BLOTA|nr:hypothetical protein RDWZM_007074 [Blomia tropicalis]